MKVFVVDDEPLALQSMVRMLERQGVEVTASFPNPREALDPAGWQGADTAFIDIEMPGMNGLELAARLQTLDPELRVVFVTAYDQYAVKAFDIAAVDYLIKPVRTGRLVTTLDRLRDSRRIPTREHAEQPPVLCFMHDLGIDAGGGKIAEVSWRTSKAKELFAYLVHTRDKSVSKEQLQDLLWPDLDVEKAMANLHTTVYQVRQTLKAEELPIQIVYTGGRYRVEMSGVELDTERWETELQQAILGQDEGRLYRLLLDGYKGDYLQTEGYLWAENERERLRIKWLQQASEQAYRLETGGLAGDAIVLYQAVQKRFPVWEPCYLGLMRCFDKLGDAGEVKNQYAKLQRTLEEELDMQPEKDISAWYDNWTVKRAQG